MADSQKNKLAPPVVIYTDGACRGNPGPGGWGVVLLAGEHEKELSGAEPETTNNRMELTAAIRALAALKRPCSVALYTDSQYVRKGITEWLPQWKLRDWRTADKKAVKNVDLWQALEHEIERHGIEWHWVKGHAGVPGNERADRLANEAIDEMLEGKRIADSGWQEPGSGRDELRYHRAQFPNYPLSAIRYPLLLQMDFIDLKTQYQRVRESMNRRMQAVLDHGQFILGAEGVELERKLAEYVGVKHCIGASSGTDTLLIALMAYGIGRGDEVITSPFTFIATGEMIALAGAKPVFVDIDARTYNIDPRLIEAAITPRTKAIMPVSLYGQCGDMDGINAVARKHRIPVIEDGAQSFGAKYRGKRSCGLSEVGSTSFFPSKPLGCYGDGGALFTDDDDLAKVMREIRVHGQDRRYHHPRLGINGRLDTLQAAVLLAKMEVFEDEVAARMRIGGRYSEMIAEAFRDQPDPARRVTTPLLAPGCTSVYAQYTIEVTNREKVEQSLKAQGIPTAVHYPVPLHMQPVFADLGLGAGAFPVSEAAGRRVLSLPMHPYLTEAQQARVVQALRAAV